jgi:hypothetical protein
MKYFYNIDYAMVGRQGFGGNGDIYIESPSPLKAHEISALRKEILKNAQADWNKNPMNRMTRECPIQSIAILNIFEEVRA